MNNCLVNDLVTENCHFLSVFVSASADHEVCVEETSLFHLSQSHKHQTGKKDWPKQSVMITVLIHTTNLKGFRLGGDFHENNPKMSSREVYESNRRAYSSFPNQEFDF
jgi:hypothetical protein